MTKKKKSFGVGYNVNTDVLLKQELSKIIIPSTLKDLVPTNFRGMKTSIKKWYNKPTKFVTIFGAAGKEDIPETKLKIITDHYKSETRKMLNDIILEDPLLSPATERRINSIFEDGFHLELEIAIAFDSANRRHLTMDESKLKFESMKVVLTKHLLQQETWTDDIRLLDTMRDAGGVSFAQGKAASLISPGLLDLQPGQLPFSVEIIHYSDLGDPIVDIGLTKKIVAVKTKFEDKKICRADELVYITRNKRGYRKEGRFHGTSPLEPTITISKSVKRIYNYDIPEAIIAAYITKILFNFAEEIEESDAKLFIQNFLTTGQLAFGMQGIESTQVIQPKVDFQMMDVLEKKLADVSLSVVGVPKSMLNREHNLNRDIATIEAIQYEKFVRKPDEQLLGEEFQNQLLNPLLSIQMGMPLNEIPARIKIVRNEPEKNNQTELQENLQDKKTGEINDTSLEQKDSKSIFGASGDKGITVTPMNDGSYHIERDSTDN